MEADSVDRLRALVAEWDAVLVEERESPDPVARRRVAQALQAKARALATLGRYEDCVEVWDEMVARVADEPPPGDPLFVARILVNKGLEQHRSGQDRAAIDTLDQVIARCEQEEEDAEGRLVVARALTLQRDALTDLQRLDAALTLDGEIIRRFGGAVEPELRWRAASALAHRARTLLRDHRVSEALRDSDDLLRLFIAEDEPATLGHVGGLLLAHSRSLLHSGSPNSVLLSVAVTLAGALGEGARFAAQRLRLAHAPGIRQLQRLGVPAAATSQSRPRWAVAFSEKRRRATQALAVSRAIVDRFENDEEPDRQHIVATARILRAAALILLGHLREGSRAFDQLVDSGQEAVAEAFRGLAALRSDGGIVDELGAVANLASRARTLGQGDPRIARIAFEESMRPGATGAPASRRAKWVARLLGP